MDKNKKRGTNMRNAEIFQEFVDLLSKTLEKNRNPYTCNLERALKTHVKRCEDMLNRLQLQDSFRQKTEEKQLPEDGQQRAHFMENKDEDTKTSTLGVSEKPSAKQAEGSESGSMEIKGDDKKNVEDKIVAADSRRVKSLQEELRECKIDLEAKEKEIESLMGRMAHYGDMRTRLDQRHVEDTLSLNRQSRVEQDFKAFTSDERIDTCIMIQNGNREKTDINAKILTSMMFEVVYEYVFATKAAMTDVFKGILKFAVDNGPYIGHIYSNQNVQRTNELSHVEVPLSLRGSDCPRHVLDGLLLAIKESAPEINTDIFLSNVKQDIFRAAQKLPRERSCKLNLSEKLLYELDDYLKACIKLTWRMVTQVPPLRLEYHTFTYKRECHKIVESQDDVGDDRYQDHRVYYLWPGLVDGGGRTIIKGEVALEK